MRSAMFRSMVLTLFLSAPVGATAVAAPVEVSASQLLTDIQKKYEGVDVLRASFTQSTSSPLYGDSSQTGQLTVQRPKRMRWDFVGEGKLFVSDGDTMWIYSKAENQVIRYKDFGSQSSAADALLQSLDKLGDLFEVTALPSDELGPRLALSPKDEALKAQVKRIELGLHTSLDLREVLVLDAYDGKTTLSFGEVKLGGEVAPETFQFSIPDGASVVDANG